ncbi:hypothetical protein DMB38_15680 [Streptomyces sp. WAC 06738]|uniref:hypothetical protein n=1 Tax=Streptomyces sp. WAC 06738 TaxID=2203210 RepID=UPI000F6E8E41|nr:hypothetical protein [Streptomyces sp. WAC 06738]AZM47056.1 hypothetical protein DMB38_15680 [Streptomyces sp. WAC 06738]
MAVGSVRVVFVDAETEAEFARSEFAPGQLPDSFAHETRLELGGESWAVVRAEPPTAEEFLRSGSLVLTLRRVQQIDPQELTYSLPTIFDPLPPTEDSTGPGEHFVIHEDDWRQAEMVSRQLAGQVEAEMRAIHEVFRQHSRVIGEGASSVRVFDRIHLRQTPTAPLSGEVSLRRLSELLPVGGRPYTGVCFGDDPGRVAGSFAIAADPVTVYGQAHDDRVTTLCLMTSPDAAAESGSAVAGLAQVMRECDLLLADWCTGRLLDASAIGAFVDPA